MCRCRESRPQTNTLSPLGRLRQHSPGGSRQPGHGPTSTATSGQKRATPPVPSVLGGYGRLPLALLWSNAAPPAPGANVSPSGPAASLTERRPGNTAVFKVPSDRGGSGFCKEMSDWDTCASGDAPPPGRPALRAPTRTSLCGTAANRRAESFLGVSVAFAHLQVPHSNRAGTLVTAGKGAAHSRQAARTPAGSP